MMKERIWGTIRFYDNRNILVYERKYYTKEGRVHVLKEMSHRHYSYYHIMPSWEEKTRRIIYDAPKGIITRPEAKYDNKQFL